MKTYAHLLVLVTVGAFLLAGHVSVAQQDSKQPDSKQTKSADDDKKVGDKKADDPSSTKPDETNDKGDKEPEPDAKPTLKYPLAVAAAGDGKMFIVDRDLPGVWQAKDGKLSLYFQASKKFRTPLNVPRCAAIGKKGQLLVGCSPTRDVYAVGGTGEPKGLTGGGSGGIGVPMDIGVLKSGDLIVSDLEQHCLWKVPAAGGKPKLFAKVPAPRGLFVDAKDQVWVVTTLQDPVRRVSADGKKVEAIVKGRPFRFPSDLVVDADGTIYVCDGFSKAIWRVAPEGEPEKWVEGDPLVHPVSLAKSGKKLLVADPRAGGIIEVDADGKAQMLELTVAE